MTPELNLTRSRLTTPRAAAIAGILFSLLYFTVIILIRSAVPEKPEDMGDWLSTGWRSVQLALNLLPFAGIAFLWFIGVVRDRLGQHEDRFFATVFFGSGLLFLAMLFASAAPACDFSGTVLAAGAGYFSTVRLVEGLGVHAAPEEVSPEFVAANWTRIDDASGARPFANAGDALIGPSPPRRDELHRRVHAAMNELYPITAPLDGAEHRAFRDTVRRFIAQEITPHHAQWERDGQVPHALWRRAGELGLLCLTLPEAYGGAGADFGYSAIVVEEMARAGASGPLFYLHSDIDEEAQLDLVRQMLEAGVEAMIAMDMSHRSYSPRSAGSFSGLSSPSGE